MPIWITGRKEELAQISRALRAERFVTLIGPGGVGKSTLAREIARRHRKTAFWADLALVDDLDRLRSTILAAFGSSSLGDAAVSVERTNALLVLDNCDASHAGWEPIFNEIRTALPNLKILTTSRRPLKIADETSIQILPLATEVSRGAMSSPAVDMLTARVQTARRGLWFPSSTDANRIHRLAQFAEGLPLALELIAARSQTLTLTELEEVFNCDRSDGRSSSFGVLSNVYRQSLIHLSVEACEALRRLTVFPDSWDEGASRALDVSRIELDSLVESSLVEARFENETIRYRLLDPIREAIRLDDFGGAKIDEWSRRHALHYLDRVRPEKLSPFRESPADTAAISNEQANIIQAQRWFGNARMTEECSIVTLALAIMHLLRMSRMHAFEWIRTQLPMASGNHAAFGHVLCCASLAAMNVGEHTEAKCYLDRAIEIAETQSERFLWCRCMTLVGHLSAFQRQPMENEERLLEAIQFMRETGSWRLPSVLLGTGLAARARGDLGAARRWFESGIDDEAQNGNFAGANHLALAEVAFLESSYHEAANLWHNMFVVHSDLRFWNEATYCLLGLAACAILLGYPETGLRFEGVSKSLARRMLVPPSPFESEWQPAYWQARLAIGADAENLVRSGMEASHEAALIEVIKWRPKDEGSGIARRLREFSLLASLDRREMQVIVSSLRVQKYDKGSVVLVVGQLSDGAMRVVLHGQLSRQTISGEAPVGHEEPILDGVFLKDLPCPETIIANKPTHVAVISASTIESVAGLRRTVVSSLAVRAQHRSNSSGKLDDRLLLFARSHTVGGVGSFKMPMTQVELAMRFGVTRESVARALARLEDSGHLVRHKNSLWIVK